MFFKEGNDSNLPNLSITPHSFKKSLQVISSFFDFTVYSFILHPFLDPTEYRKLTSEGVQSTTVFGKPAIKVSPEAITKLTEQAFIDIAHLLRPAHLQQLRKILDDPESSVHHSFRSKKK